MTECILNTHWDLPRYSLILRETHLGEMNSMWKGEEEGGQCKRKTPLMCGREISEKNIQYVLLVRE